MSYINKRIKGEINKCTKKCNNKEKYVNITVTNLKLVTFLLTCVEIITIISRVMTMEVN